MCLEGTSELALMGHACDKTTTLIPVPLPMSVSTADDSHSTTTLYVQLNTLHVSSPPNKTAYRQAMNEILSKIKKWASLLLNWWFISSALHLQCFGQKCTYLPLQCWFRTTGVSPCLAWQRRAMKVNEVSWHPTKAQFLTLLWGNIQWWITTSSLGTCQVQSMRKLMSTEPPTFSLLLHNWPYHCMLQCLHDAGHCINKYVW